MVAVRRRGDLVAGCFQHVFQRAQVLRLVLDAKNSRLPHQLLRPFDIGTCAENSLQFSERPAV